MQELLQVVMLPTNEASKIYLMSDNKTLKLCSEVEVSHGAKGNNQHLYLTSNEEIREGDYVYCPTLGIVHKYENNMTLVDDEKKIIATTDKSLKRDHNLEFAKGKIKPTIQGHCVPYSLEESYLPQIPKSFIKAYVEAQGNIKEVLVEYEKAGYWRNLHRQEINAPKPEFIHTHDVLKLCEDNTVIITISEEKKYTKEEMLQMYQLGRIDAIESSYQRKMINNLEQNL